MPLSACPDCQGLLSDQAPACPHCGRPMKAPRGQSADDSFWRRNRGCGDLVLYGGLVLAIVLLLGLRGACP